MTLRALVQCAEREEVLRRRYYPARVERGQMTQEAANHEIQCMAEIACKLRHELKDQFTAVRSLASAPIQEPPCHD